MRHGIGTALGIALAFACADATLAKSPTDVNNLTGTWVNVDPATRGIVRIVITNDAGGFRIHTYGACAPTPCDHGAISASSFSAGVSSPIAVGFSGQYNFGFSTMLVTGKRSFEFDGTYLQLETRTKFTGGSDGRFDYMSSGLFRKR